MIQDVIKFRVNDGQLQYLTSNGVWNPIYTLTVDELAAINNSDDPSSVNVVITETDLSRNAVALNSGTIDWSAGRHFTSVIETNTELFDENLPAYPVVKDITLTISSDSGESLTLPTYWKVITGTYDTSGVPNLIKVFCENDTSEIQVDTITPTGTNGVAVIAAAGSLTKHLVFTDPRVGPMAMGKRVSR
jgi:hypothetical protein